MCRPTAVTIQLIQWIYATSLHVYYMGLCRVRRITLDTRNED